MSGDSSFINRTTRKTLHADLYVSLRAEATGVESPVHWLLRLPVANPGLEIKS
jgi:hypothetical protein